MESIVEKSGILALRAKCGQNICSPIYIPKPLHLSCNMRYVKLQYKLLYLFFYFHSPKLGVRLRLPPSQFGLRGSVRHSALPPAAGAEEGERAQAIRGRQEGGDKVTTWFFNKYLGNKVWLRFSEATNSVVSSLPLGRKAPQASQADEEAFRLKVILFLFPHQRVSN